MIFKYNSKNFWTNETKNLVIDTEKVFSITINGVKISFIDGIDMGFHLRTTNGLSQVFLSSSMMMDFAKRMGSDIIDEELIKKNFIAMHEIGHALFGSSEEKADVFGLRNISYEAAASQLYIALGMEGKRADECIMCAINFAGRAIDNDDHKNPIRDQILLALIDIINKAKNTKYKIKNNH